MLTTLADRATQSRELRSFTAAEYDIRGDSDTGQVTFTGIASVVDTPYAVRDMLGEYQETIAAGAFAKTLKEKADVRLLVNHVGVPLARTKSGTLQLDARPDLRARALLDPANPTVQEITSAMARRDIDQMSIGFRVHRQEWNGDYTERTIREVELFDVSVVTFPASPTTTASLRAVEELLEAFPADMEHDPDELRRAIAHLSALLPTDKALNPFALRDAAELAALERKIAARLAIPV